MAKTQYSEDFYDSAAVNVDFNDIAKAMDEFDAKMAKDPISESRPAIDSSNSGPIRMSAVCDSRYLILFVLIDDQARAFGISHYPENLRAVFKGLDPLDKGG